MKKGLLVALAAVTLLTACKKDNVPCVTPQGEGAMFVIHSVQPTTVTLDHTWYYSFYADGKLTKHKMTLKTAWKYYDSMGSRRDTSISYPCTVSATATSGVLGTVFIPGIIIPNDRDVTFDFIAENLCGGPDTQYRTTYNYYYVIHPF